MVFTFKIGALALLSTVGTLWHTMAPSSLSQVTRNSTAIACAPRFGVSSAEAELFLDQLQSLPVDQALQKAMFTRSPMNMMLLAVAKERRTDFEECAGLEPGLITLIASAKRSKSSYRSFLEECMKCAGEAFRSSKESWPSEGMLFDMVDIMSSDWLASSTHLIGYATKYKPAISALGELSRTEFSRCMKQVQQLPGSPAGMSGRRRLEAKPTVSKFDTVMADVSGHEVPVGAVPIKGGPTRRLMKGGFSFSSFFFSSFGNGDDQENVAACFGQEGTVLNAVSEQQMRIGDVKVGDMLVTTVPHDEVVYVHTVNSNPGMLKLVLEHTSIELTPSHLLSTPTGMKPARELEPQDTVWVQQGSESSLSKVLRIERSSGPVIAPVTKSGTLVVNGVVASCYANGDHDMFHLILAPYRAMYSASPGLAVQTAEFGYQVFFEPLSMLAPLTTVLALSFGATLAVLSLPFVAAGITAQRVHGAVSK